MTRITLYKMAGNAICEQLLPMHRFTTIGDVQFSGCAERLQCSNETKPVRFLTIVSLYTSCLHVLSRWFGRGANEGTGIPT